MATTKSGQKAVAKYKKANYEYISLTLKKGEREPINAHAEARGESVNTFIKRAISETMARDNAAPAGAPAPEDPAPADADP